MAISPAGGATQVPLGSLVTVTFSEPMAPASISTANFTVSARAAVPGAVGVSGAVATFTPAVPLAAGTVYTATVGGSVTDLAGNPLGHDRSWTFITTGAVNDWWMPAQGLSWQWQLSTPPAAPYLEVGMYDVDLFDTGADTVAAMQALGIRVTCYLSAGTYEPGRPDASQFPDGSARFGGVNVLGRDVLGWPGEKWLDIRSSSLAPIMAARLDQCRDKGFDAVEPDNVDGYANDSGWPLTAADQLAYNRWFASEAHSRGLSVALKNDLDQVQALLASFDWALNEQCFEYDECDLLQPFIADGKAVFNVEYGLAPGLFCYDPQVGACARRFSSMQKNLDLDAWRAPCACP